MSDPPALSLPAAPKLPSLEAVSAIAKGPEQPAGSPTELYARIGRGAMACWFGAKGALKKDYIYHADAEPASRGGQAEIVIHQRDPSQPNPRGPKAFRVRILPAAGETATVETENLKIPDAMAATMIADVARWSKGENGCSEGSAAAGWSPAQADAGKDKAAGAKKSAKAKSKTDAAPAPQKQSQ